jgi:hypothetical protein
MTKLKSLIILEVENQVLKSNLISFQTVLRKLLAIKIVIH